jgi:hypothetical protein
MIFSIIFILVNVFFSQNANADCNTGFACSLSDLEATESVMLTNTKSLINNYFARNIIEPDYISKSTPITNYNDLFIFNTIL